MEKWWIIRYHLKRKEKIKEKYNCQHVVNECIFGINLSENVEDERVQRRSFKLEREMEEANEKYNNVYKKLVS